MGVGSLAQTVYASASLLELLSPLSPSTPLRESHEGRQGVAVDPKYLPRRLRRPKRLQSFAAV